MAASEGLFDDKVKSQRALALKAVLDILGGIVDGTPFPKGHGDIKDISTFKPSGMLAENPYDNTKLVNMYNEADIVKAPTILESDKTESEEV